ncbi:MAG: hypothetical protein M3O71_28775 [Bacteroidota bacterium]|nr:hypothetical protein [Bacteroidota bacterium]
MFLDFGHNPYDAYLNKVTVHRTQVGGAKPGGEFIFRVENGRVHYTGVLYPMIGDGACDYSGKQI